MTVEAKTAVIAEKKLNLGCGRSPMEGYVNLDCVEMPGVDVVADCDRPPLPFEDDTFDEVLGEHFFEHLQNPLGFMAELHRVCKPDAQIYFAMPYGGSDDAWGDPTHARPYFEDSFGYFSQPFYWRADYGYRGDFQPVKVMLKIWNEHMGQTAKQTMGRVKSLRNVVFEMGTLLRCIKPIREPERSLIENPTIQLFPIERVK